MHLQRVCWKRRGTHYPGDGVEEYEGGEDQKEFIF